MSEPDVDERLKQKVSELQCQLREEQSKHKSAKEALLAEQQHFANELARLEDLTKGVFFLLHMQRLLHSTFPLPHDNVLIIDYDLMPGVHA
jgi:uncharacterized protein YqcC (DUF446 family)